MLNVLKKVTRFLTYINTVIGYLLIVLVLTMLGLWAFGILVPDTTPLLFIGQSLFLLVVSVAVIVLMPDVREMLDKREDL